ncbi:flagellar protein FlaG [Rheinheimera sediminis]|uniref:flagellar protein FlaG n=1 Tax=Rheinheimera sp. YQF-1 TaxID=2499626 RepID=UPI001646D5A5|nr:flagellar protein FlaG [Rheinheimera sp. YQF-1]
MSSVITGNFGYQPSAPKAAAGDAVELNKMKSTAENTAPELKVKAEPAQSEQAITQDQLGEAVENINQFVNSQGRTLNFSVDEESGKPVVKVVDFETKEVIRQIPSEEVLTMAKAIKKLQEDLGSATGLMIDKTI